MNISTPALSIAGGVVLFIIAIRMIFPSHGPITEAEDRDPFIPPAAQERGGRVVEVVQRGGEVGAPSERAGEFLPGRGGGQ